MPLEKTESQIRARVKNPDDFIDGTLRTKTIDEQKGINIIIGKLHDGTGGMVTHSYRFNIEKGWDVYKVKEWCKAHEIVLMSNESGVMCFSDLTDVEIFATGTWHGRTFTQQDLDNIVASYNAIGGRLKPYLKLGHDDGQKLIQKDGYPAAGWVTNLKRVGNKLVASFKDVPKVIAELIDRGAYKRISSEIYFNLSDKTSGTEYPAALRAVALLGGDTPEVNSLSDVVALYIDNENAHDVFAFTAEDMAEPVDTAEPEKQETKGDDSEVNNEELENLKTEYANKVEAISAENEALKTQVESLREFSDMFDNKQDIKTFIEDLKAQKSALEAKATEYTKVIEKAKENEIVTYVEKCVADNKIFPAQRAMLTKILFSAENNSEVIEFTREEAFGLKEKMPLKDVIKSFVESMPDLKLFKEFTSSSNIVRDKDEERRELCVKFQAEHGVTFGAAQVAIQKIRPDLFEAESK